MAPKKRKEPVPTEEEKKQQDHATKEAERFAKRIRIERAGDKAEKAQRKLERAKKGEDASSSDSGEDEDDEVIKDMIETAVREFQPKTEFDVKEVRKFIEAVKETEKVQEILEEKFGVFAFTSSGFGGAEDGWTSDSLEKALEVVYGAE